MFTARSRFLLCAVALVVCLLTLYTHNLTQCLKLLSALHTTQLLSRITVVFPRFMKSTGFILNGAFCFELLTKQGWTPTNDIESVLIQIRAIMLMGGARIDFGESLPYTGNHQTT
jgi:hypothetical protein